MSRRAFNQPEHRRAPWARNKQSYRACIENTITVRSAGNASDYGVDNFSYDPDHLPEWQTPSELDRHIPSTLKNNVDDCIFAGAAVRTALERVEGMVREAVDRIDPKSSHQDLLDHMRRDESGGNTNTSRPEMSITSVLSPLMSPFVARGRALDKLASSLGYVKRDAGLESPPFTPLDLQGRIMPAVSLQLGQYTAVPSPCSTKLSQVSPPPSARSSFAMDKSDNSGVNYPAWETFIRSFQAELDDLRQNNITRLNGYIRLIEMTLFELGMERNLSQDTKVALRALSEWLMSVKAKRVQYDAWARSIEVPRLDIVLLERSVVRNSAGR